VAQHLDHNEAQAKKINADFEKLEERGNLWYVFLVSLFFILHLLGWLEVPWHLKPHFTTPEPFLKQWCKSTRL
jgi:hypothetical protein